LTVTATPRPPEHDELEALIEEARQRARRRRGYVIALLLVAMSAAAVYALLAQGDGGAGGSAAGVRPVGVGSQMFRPGEFWYTRTVSSQHQWLPAGGTIEWRPGYFRPRGPEVLFELRVSEETWVGVDGAVRDRLVVAGARFASARGRAEWAAYGRPVPDFNHVWLGWVSHDGITFGGDEFPPPSWYSWLGEWLGPGGWDVGDGLFSYSELLSLPTDPAALRARLHQAERALASREARLDRHGTGAPVGAFGELGDIAGLLTSPLPAAVRVALFRAAITMRGAKVDGRARDALGRPGVAVSASNGPAFQQLIFNRATGALLAEAVSPNDVVVAQGVVNSPYALPKRVSPVRAVGAPPPPPTAAIAPAVGTRTTVFKLMLASPGHRRSPRPPALNWLLIGTPGLRCFAGFAPQLPPLVPSATTRLAGRLIYVYRLGAERVHRQGWCPGRYELTVLPDYSRHPEASHPVNLLPGLGSSIFFQVR
jgi:hypothetical protein